MKKYRKFSRVELEQITLDTLQDILASIYVPDVDTVPDVEYIRLVMDVIKEKEKESDTEKI